MFRGMIMKIKYFLVLLVPSCLMYSCGELEEMHLKGSDGELCASDAIWTHGRGDLQNTRRASPIRQKGCFTGPIDTPRVVWSFPIGGPGTEAPPVIGDDGTIYLVGEYPGEPPGGGVRNSGLMAITPAGSLKWFFSCPINIGNAIAAIYAESVALASDGTVYFRCSSDNSINALNPNDGTIKWKYESSGFTSVAVDKDQNIYSANDTIFCFNPDGSIKWRYFNETPIGYCEEITLSRNYIFCAFYGNGILALDYQGRKKWFYPVDYQDDGGKDAILVDEDENIYLKVNSNNIKSWDRKGSLRWEGSVGFFGMTQPALRGNYLYFGVFGGLYKLDKATGKQVEVIAELPSYVDQEASPLIDDNGVIYMVSGGILSAFHDDGQKLWEKKLAYGSYFAGYPALSSDGTIYLASVTYTSNTPSCSLFSIHK